RRRRPVQRAGGDVRGRRPVAGPYARGCHGAADLFADLPGTRMSSPAAELAPDPQGPGAGSPALVVSGLGKHYGGVRAVDDISLTLAAGERMGVIGPNGAGKTTLFTMIAGDVSPTSGTIEMFGRDVTHMSTVRRARLGVGRTFQVSNLFREMSVLDNVRVAARGGSRRSRVFWRLQG